MPLDWDIKLNSVSIKETIERFEIRMAKGSYVKELTIASTDSTFYDQFTYTVLPTAQVEVFTKISDDWISQGLFFIEKPVLIVNIDSTTSPGVWGRSGTAKAGPPFAVKISKSYEASTDFNTIIAEMATLCGITITSEIENYTIVANTYAIDNLYPIDVIVELAEFAAAYVVSTSDGELIIKDDIFHPLAEDHTFTDTKIVDLSENINIPDFGNRIRISALGGVGSGYTIQLEALDDAECLPADGVSQGTLLAFVFDADNESAPDNTIVTWSIEDGATLAETYTGTGNYLLENRKHIADNYSQVTVDFPVVEVLGIWAYADSGNNNNFWNSLSGSFDGKVITVGGGFSFCDQALRITYITGGCAVNRITAGVDVVDVETTVEVEGARGSLVIQLGNTCACGSSLSAIINPFGAVCFGNLAHVLIWATINNAPATGYPIKARIKSGCGELSSENKVLKSVSVLNETGFTRNIISGVTQVQSAIIPAGTSTPKVYLKTDTSKSNDLYSSHDGKLIDLDTIQESNIEVVIDYHADGATAISWRTIGADKDCDATISITMADGTEAGLEQEISTSATDCTEPDEIPDYNGDYSDYDPDDYDQDSEDGGFDDDGNDSGDSGALLDPCDVIILNRVTNIDNVIEEDDINNLRFGTNNSDNCPEEGEDWECTCAELCESEVHYKGGTYDESQTIHEIVIEAGETEGTPAYNEAFEAEKQSQLDACAVNCEAQRADVCGCDPLVYDTDNSVDTLADSSSGVVYWTGDAGPYTVSVSGSGFYTDAGFLTTTIETNDREVTIYTDAACGPCTVTITGGCSEVSGEVLSTNGSWSSIGTTQHASTYDSWPPSDFFACTTNFAGTTRSDNDRIIGKYALVWDGEWVPDPSIVRTIDYGTSYGFAGGSCICSASMDDIYFKDDYLDLFEILIGFQRLCTAEHWNCGGGPRCAGYWLYNSTRIM